MRGRSFLGRVSGDDDTRDARRRARKPELIPQIYHCPSSPLFFRGRTAAPHSSDLTWECLTPIKYLNRSISKGFDAGLSRKSLSKGKGFNWSLDTGESLTRVRSEVGEGQERSFLLQKKKKRTQERERERWSQSILGEMGKQP